MTETANKSLVQCWFDEVWNKGQEGTIDRLLSPDAVAYGLGDTDDEVRGPEQFKQFVRTIRGSFQDLQITVEDILAESDKVTVRVLLHGTHTGGSIGVPATGRPIRVSGIVLVRISNGQIVEAWNSWDQLRLLRQIGALPGIDSPDRFLKSQH
jgi:steroid delta-isomerase-like uncharacterized protein